MNPATRKGGSGVRGVRLSGAFLFGAALALGLSALSCGHATPPSSPPPSPQADELPRADAIPGRFEVRVKVVARSSRGETELTGLVSKKQGAFALTGLTSSGAHSFLLAQEGAKVTFTRYTQDPVAFSPTYVLQDLHRILDAPLGMAIPDGQRSGLVAKVLVKEHWQEGQLRHRSYTETEGTGELPKISIAYEGIGPQRLPAHVTLKHHQLDYTLAVDFLEP